MINLIAPDSSSVSPLSSSTRPLRLASFSLHIFQSDFQFPAFLSLLCFTFSYSFDQRSEPISTCLSAAKHHQVHTKIFLCYFHFSRVIYFPRKGNFVLFNWNPQWFYFDEKKIILEEYLNSKLTVQLWLKLQPFAASTKFVKLNSPIIKTKSPRSPQVQRNWASKEEAQKVAPCFTSPW